MMAVLCPNHFYLWGRLDLGHICEFVAFVGCTTCIIDND